MLLMLRAEHFQVPADHPVSPGAQLGPVWDRSPQPLARCRRGVRLYGSGSKRDAGTRAPGRGGDVETRRHGDPGQIDNRISAICVLPPAYRARRAISSRMAGRSFTGTSTTAVVRLR